MPTDYRYRLLKGTSWGIAIDLRAESALLPPGPLPPRAVKIAEALWLEMDMGRLPAEEELAFLSLGLRLVAADVASRRPARTLVRIVGLDYNLCDYQPEGLAAAAAGWAATEFGFPVPEIPVAFDGRRNRYVFAFDQAAPPLGRSAATGS